MKKYNYEVSGGTLNASRFYKSFACALKLAKECRADVWDSAGVLLEDCSGAYDSYTSPVAS